MNLDDLIRHGLTSPDKRLPSALLYDALGSILFEAITLLPEYGVTQADLRVLEAHRADMVAIDRPLELVELGPGAGRKARLLVEALRVRQPHVHFVGVDVSRQALAECKRNLEEVEGVRVDVVEGDYLAGLRQAVELREPGASQLVLFLGSNLSNFDRARVPEFFRGLREPLRAGDAVLLSTDLDKDPARLLPAYDDALGVTAAFDKNVLLRLNREWGANFPLDAFRHRARWNERERRVEMHLEATHDCEVVIGSLGLRVAFRAGESIWTESSHRFSREELAAWAADAGFVIGRQWLDARWPLAQTWLDVA